MTLCHVNKRGVLNFQFEMENGDYKLAFQSEPMRLAELAIASGVMDFQLDGDVLVQGNWTGKCEDIHWWM